MISPQQRSTAAVSNDHSSGLAFQAPATKPARITARYNRRPFSSKYETNKVRVPQQPSNIIIQDADVGLLDMP